MVSCTNNGLFCRKGYVVNSTDSLKYLANLFIVKEVGSSSDTYVKEKVISLIVVSSFPVTVSYNKYLSNRGSPERDFIGGSGSSRSGGGGGL